MRRVRELLLRSVWYPVAGPALQGAYLDVPLTSSGRCAAVRTLLERLGISCEVNAAGVFFCLEALFARGVRDTSVYARVYAAAAVLDEEEPLLQHSDSS